MRPSRPQEHRWRHYRHLHPRSRILLSIGKGDPLANHLKSLCTILLALAVSAAAAQTSKAPAPHKVKSHPAPQVGKHPAPDHGVSNANSTKTHEAFEKKQKNISEKMHKQQKSAAKQWHKQHPEAR
jgi:hypothetical protein